MRVLLADEWWPEWGSLLAFLLTLAFQAVGFPDIGVPRAALAPRALTVNDLL
jgi:hypothetical protein